MCAAEFGHLEVIKYALNEGCPEFINNRPPWYPSWVITILRYGHLEVLKWYIMDVWKQRANEKIGLVAIEITTHYGHLHILKWFHEIGTPPTMDVCMMAMPRGHLDIIKWTASLGVLTHPERCLGMYSADEKCCERIRENCCD
jgi:hypothetical protein